MKGQQENIKNLIKILNEKDNNIKLLKNEVATLTEKLKLYESEEHIKLVFNDISGNTDNNDVR